MHVLLVSIGDKRRRLATPTSGSVQTDKRLMAKEEKIHPANYNLKVILPKIIYKIRKYMKNLQLRFLGFKRRYLTCSTFVFLFNNATDVGIKMKLHKVTKNICTNFYRCKITNNSINSGSTLSNITWQRYNIAELFNTNQWLKFIYSNDIKEMKTHDDWH